MYVHILETFVPELSTILQYWDKKYDLVRDSNGDIAIATYALYPYHMVAIYHYSKSIENLLFSKKVIDSVITKDNVAHKKCRYCIDEKSNFYCYNVSYCLFRFFTKHDI